MRDDTGAETVAYATAEHKRRRFRIIPAGASPVLVGVGVAELMLIGYVFASNNLLAPESPRTKTPETVTGWMVKPDGALAKTLEMHRQAEGTLPTSLDRLMTRPSDDAGQWRGPYILDPNSLLDAWGHPLRYRVPGVHNPDGYDLWSAGPDGDDGTDDDIGNW